MGLVAKPATSPGEEIEDRDSVGAAPSGVAAMAVRADGVVRGVDRERGQRGRARLGAATHGLAVG